MNELNDFIEAEIKEKIRIYDIYFQTEDYSFGLFYIK